MLRVALTETALQIKKLDLGPVDHMLSRAPDPPAAEAVRDALATLTDAGALDAAGALTPLGHHLARLPVDVRAGKIIVLGAVLGCLRPALTIAAYLSSKSPFVAPHDERDAADRVRHAFAAAGSLGIAAGQRSDHLVVVAAYEGWRAACVAGGTRAGVAYSRRHCLCPVTLNALHGARCYRLGLTSGFADVPRHTAQTCAASSRSC
jgi:ATP-dependent RNA helicase DHX29